MGLGIGLELGGHLFYVCLSAKRKRLLQGGHLKNPSLAFGHFSPLPPMYSGIFFSFFFSFSLYQIARPARWSSRRRGVGF